MAVSTVNRRQFANLLTVALVSYIVASSHYIFGPSSPYLMIVTSELIACLNVVLLIVITVGVIRNIKALLVLADAMGGIDMNEIRRGIRRKIWMLVLFEMVIFWYYAWITFYMAAMPFLDITDRATETFSGINSMATWCAVTALVIIFHPCFFTAAFQLGQVGGEDSEASEEPRNLAPYVEVTVNVHRMREDAGNAKRTIVVRPVDVESGELTKRIVFLLLLA